MAGQHEPREQLAGAAVAPARIVTGQPVVVRGHVGVELPAAVAVVTAVRVRLLDHAAPLALALYEAATTSQKTRWPACVRCLAPLGLVAFVVAFAPVRGYPLRFGQQG